MFQIIKQIITSIILTAATATLTLSAQPSNSVFNQVSFSPPPSNRLEKISTTPVPESPHSLSSEVISPVGHTKSVLLDANHDYQNNSQNNNSYINHNTDNASPTIAQYSASDCGSSLYSSALCELRARLTTLEQKNFIGALTPITYGFSVTTPQANVLSYLSIPSGWKGGGSGAFEPLVTNLLTIASTIYSEAGISAPNRSDFRISSGDSVTIDKLVLGSLISDPSSGHNGESYYNSSTNTFRCYQNSAWKDCDTGAGSVPVASNSLDFDEFVPSMSLDTNTTINLNGKYFDIGNKTLYLDPQKLSVGIGGTSDFAKFTVSQANASGTAMNIFQYGSGDIIDFYGSRSHSIPTLKLSQFGGDYAGDGISLARFDWLNPTSGTISSSIYQDIEASRSIDSFILNNANMYGKISLQNAGNEVAWATNDGLHATTLFADLNEFGGFPVCHPTNGREVNARLSDCNVYLSADYMEMYPVDVRANEYGTIVMPSSDSYAITKHSDRVGTLIPTTREYDDKLLGVISLASVSGPFNSVGHDLQTSDNPQPIALNGRVKVKVTNTNGTIKPGDFITSSDLPGVGMKATKAGRVLGMALESSKETNDPNEVQKVMVFINTHYYVPTVSISSPGLNSPDIQGSALIALFKNLMHLVSDTYGIALDYGYAKVEKVSSQFIESDNLEIHNGITLFDTETGDPYCIRISNGDMTHSPGRCESNHALSNTSIPAPILTQTPAPLTINGGSELTASTQSPGLTQPEGTASVSDLINSPELLSSTSP